jgi:hypothetical protein
MSEYSEFSQDGRNRYIALITFRITWRLFSDFEILDSHNSAFVVTQLTFVDSVARTFADAINRCSWKKFGLCESV